MIFGDSGWEAINSIQHKGLSVRSYLESMGLVVLNFPHFAQNFQQRAIFMLSPDREEEYFLNKPSHKAYAPAAQRMRSELLKAMGQSYSTKIEVSLITTKSKGVFRHDKAVAPKDASKNPERPSRSDSGLFSDLFYLLHQSGDKLYPIKMKNRDTGKIAFRVSKGGAGGNTKEAGMEIEDEHIMKKFVFEQGYAVRASTRNKSRNGLFKIGQRSIIRAVEEN